MVVVVAIGVAAFVGVVVASVAVVAAVFAFFVAMLLVPGVLWLWQ